MRRNFFRFSGMGLLLAGGVCLFSCNNPTNFAADLYHGEDIKVITDSSVVANCDSSTRLRTDNLGADYYVNGSIALSENMIGSLYDPQLGELNASTYIQFTPGSSIPSSFGVIDLTSSGHLSLKDQVFVTFARLNLSVNNIYGKAGQKQILHVYQLSDTLQFDSVYRTQSTVLYSPVDITADQEGSPIPGFPISISDTSTTIELSIPLSTKFAQDIVDSLALAAYSGSTIYNYKHNFTHLLHGLLIKTEPVDSGVSGKANGAMYTLASTSGSTNLKIVYLSKTLGSNSSSPDSNLLYFYSNQDAQRFTHIDQLAPTQTYKNLVYHPGTLPTSVAIRGGHQLSVSLKFPKLNTLKPSVLAQATLRMYVDNTKLDPEGVLQPPLTVNAFLAKSDSVTADSSVYIGAANYNAKGGYYDIPLRNYVDIVQSKRVNNYGVIITVANRHSRVTRAFFYGNYHGKNSPRLKILYTPAP